MPKRDQIAYIAFALPATSFRYTDGPLRTAATEGAPGVSLPSQGVAGTRAGAAYGAARSWSLMPLRFSISATMLKWTWPPAFGRVRVMSICSMISCGGNCFVAAPTRLVNRPGQMWRPRVFWVSQ